MSFNRSSASSGFTLVELLVVIAMLMILMGAVTTSVVQAQRRAKISQATTAVQEMTNAILSYENYVKSGSMPTFTSWQKTTEGNIAFLLGKGEEGEFGKVPVLYNASLSGGKVVDPWGNPYEMKIVPSTVKVEDDLLNNKPRLGVQFPNFNRRPPWDLQ